MKSLINKVKKEEKKAMLQKRKCVICQAPARFKVKGLDNLAYCKPCAQEAFRYLSYLEKIPT
jgi:hypothetical protein